MSIKRVLPFAIAIAIASTVLATPLRLDYVITDLGGGVYKYDFTFVVDNNDGSYMAGQTWRWFVFGDAPSPGPRR